MIIMKTNNHDVTKEKNGSDRKMADNEYNTKPCNKGMVLSVAHSCLTLVKYTQVYSPRSAIREDSSCTVPACCLGLHLDAVLWASGEVMEAEVQPTEPERTE